jgi:AcrR family transcriptional regulator
VEDGSSETGGVGRRERKKLATREALRSAALGLFADRGFGAVTVEQICERADVASSTFFRHFATKEDVVLADYAERGRDLLAALDGQPPDARPAELLSGAMEAWRARRRPPELLRAETMLLAAEPALQAHLDRTLVAWEHPIAERLATRYDLDPTSLQVQLAAGWFVTTVRVVIREWALSGAGGDVYALGTEALGALAGLMESDLGLLR